MSRKINVDGSIKNYTHYFHLRVQYEDTDIGGIVYHTKHLSFMERGRSSLIRELGYPNEILIKNDIILVVSSADIKWIKPLKLGTIIVIETKIIKLKNFSVYIYQKVKDLDNEIIYSLGNFRIASINSKGDLVKFEKKFFEKLKKNICLTID